MSDRPSANPGLAPTPRSEKLTVMTKLAYGAGDLGTAITANILVFFLLPFFTNVAGLSAGVAGSILMIGKIADAINDPLVGMLSDRTRTRWGRRLPWMVMGAIPFAASYCLQWIVPHFSSDRQMNVGLLFAYYVLIGILFNIAYTAVNLPYTALTPELTQDYNERTNLNSFRFTFSIGGSILSLMLAGLIFRSYANDPLQQYFVLGLACALLSLVSIFWCILRIQERGAAPLLKTRQKKLLAPVIGAIAVLAIAYGVLQMVQVKTVGTIAVLAILLGLLLLLCSVTLRFSTPEAHLIDGEATRARSEVNAEPLLPLREQLRIAFSNKPFLYVIGIYLCSWLAVQLTASILVYFVVDWMGLTTADSSLVALGVQGTALIMLFFWQALSYKFGKKAVYFMGMGFWIIAQAGLLLLQPGQVGLMYVLAILAGFGVSVAYLIPWSMIPDIIELDELQTGQRREGIFYGFMVLLQKFGLALGLFLVGIVLQSAGFIESVAGQPIPAQPASALLAIRLAIGPLPTLALVGGLILTYFYPITREIHAEIRHQLQERDRLASD